MPPERSVRITALGVVSPLGVGVRAATWPRLLSGEAPPLVRSRGRECVPLP
ncbi:hypothetical protein HY251_04750, partial [bacterium]|nr:hypothetical protein [bacterium]